MDATPNTNEPQKTRPEPQKPAPPPQQQPGRDQNEVLADEVDAAADAPREGGGDGGSVGESVFLDNPGEAVGHDLDANKTPVPRAGEGYGEGSDGFAGMSKAELYAQAKALSIPNRSNMTKVQLITAIRDTLNRTSS